jgi:hypothetical protein
MNTGLLISKIPYKCSCVLLFLLGDSPAAGFWANVSKHSACSFFILPMKIEQSVPKCLCTFRRREITQKKEYNIHSTANVLVLSVIIAIYVSHKTWPMSGDKIKNRKKTGVVLTVIYIYIYIHLFNP